jgi:hypothetical protein
MPILYLIVDGVNELDPELEISYRKRVIFICKEGRKMHFTTQTLPSTTFYNDTYNMLLWAVVVHIYLTEQLQSVN